MSRKNESKRDDKKLPTYKKKIRKPAHHQPNKTAVFIETSFMTYKRAV
jgi:hypothetical protein